ncbi:MAG TPA: Zn-ribbon domain-containing OB-fold protein [Acetobacteraceae bacterium]|nr:Zn-ribbon domain-containing OB-fold protein [Acetobacteraceae bacterium]
MTDKPAPHPTKDSLPYWEAAAQGKLRLQRCGACHTVRHYPQPVCPKCYSLDVEWIEASGRGTVHSWTVAHHAFHPAFKADLPYTLLIVDLEEGPRAMGRLDPAAVTPPRIGLPVRISFADDRLPTFTPAE